MAFLELGAAMHDFIQWVVGWVPLVSDRVRGQPGGFSKKDTKLKAVRHVDASDETDEEHAPRRLQPRLSALLKKLDSPTDIRFKNGTAGGNPVGRSAPGRRRFAGITSPSRAFREGIL